MPRIPTLDMSECSNCEACLELCPTVFSQSESGYIEVLPLEEYPEDCIQEAINCCPSGCITWEETE
jgi:ferredoxin